MEEEIFKKRKLNIEKLVNFGFILEDNQYKYSKKIIGNSFRVDIIISKEGKVKGEIYDLETNDQYTNFRLENIEGDFANRVKEEYKTILIDIANNCFDEKYFLFEQSNRLTKLINEKYNIRPEFLWKKFPNYGVFRNSNSNKWFAIIMNVDKSKIVALEKKEVEILNIKLDNLVTPYLKKKNIYPGYHFNKKNWVSIILDDVLTDQELMSLIDISYNLSGEKICKK